MNCLMILALASLAYAQNAVPQDLPEVAAARFAHLAEVAKAAARVGVFNYPTPDIFRSVHSQFPNPRGFQSDTPEVAAAKARHLAEHARLSGAAPAAAGGFFAVPAAARAYPTFRELF